MGSGRCLLSQVGAGLSGSARAALRRHGMGLKALLEQSPAFTIQGPPGAEIVSRNTCPRLPDAGPCVLCLRLRGLPFSAGEQDVANFFETYGQTRWLQPEDPIRVQRKANGRPTGIALIHLVPGVLLSDVIESLHGKHMGERYIEVFAADEK